MELGIHSCVDNDLRQHKPNMIERRAGGHAPELELLIYCMLREQRLDCAFGPSLPPAPGTPVSFFLEQRTACKDECAQKEKA